MSDTGSHDVIESLAAKLRQVELTAEEQEALALALGGEPAEVTGFAYDLNPNDLSIALSTSLGFKPTRPTRPTRPNTSDSDIGPI